ncbi:MAG: hypothetical protein IJT88_02665 [Kiritimatiellae bacterium]|nr:hypothetical protein [Kiritimatiellia bacterium]
MTSSPSPNATPSPLQSIAPVLAKCLDGLVIAAGLLFLFLCMLLPLVAKAAWGGSGSPGAGPQPTRGVNIAFFVTIWCLTALATGLAAFAAKSRPAPAPDAPSLPFPRTIVILGVLLLLIAFAFLSGSLHF